MIEWVYSYKPFLVTSTGILYAMVGGNGDLAKWMMVEYFSEFNYTTISDVMSGFIQH
jgi:hypothetical protein